jgi:hypothetical protein
VHVHALKDLLQRVSYSDIQNIQAAFSEHTREQNKQKCIKNPPDGEIHVLLVCTLLGQVANPIHCCDF